MKAFSSTTLMLQVNRLIIFKVTAWKDIFRFRCTTHRPMTAQLSQFKEFRCITDARPAFHSIPVRELLLQDARPMTSCSASQVCLYFSLQDVLQPCSAFWPSFRVLLQRRSANNVVPCLFERIRCTSHRPMTLLFHFTSLSALVLSEFCIRVFTVRCVAHFPLTKSIEFHLSSMNLEIALQAWSFF